MDAVHLMRAITGRDLIIKVEGCYHGHHDSVQVSVTPEAEEVGPAGDPAQVPSSTGIPEAIIRLTLVATFNDLGSVKRLLDQHPGQVAGMIIEPVMMNAGIIEPEPGYLQGLKDLLHAHGALLTFDEVKTGLTAGPGGVTRRTGVTPDIICLAKAIGGGVAIAAIGGSAEVMEHVARQRLRDGGHVQRQPAGHRGLPGHADRGGHPRGVPAHRPACGSRRWPASSGRSPGTGLPAHVVAVGAKGCVVFSARAGP